MGRPSKGGTLFKRPECATWYANYVDADGRRRKVSTGQTEVDAAQTVLSTLMQTEREARSGRLTEKRARELISEIVERTEGIKMVHHTARQYLNGFLEAKKLNRAAGGYQRYEVVIRKFLEFLDKKADLALERVSHDDIQNFINKAHERGKRFKTITFEKKALSTAFSKAVRLGYLSVNPAANVEVPAGPDSIDKEIFSPKEMAKLLDAADSEWKGVISLAYFAGFRLLDASNLLRSNLDLKTKVIKFVPQKTMHAARRRGRKPKVLTIPMHKSLLRVLQNLAQDKSGEDPMFPSLIGRQTSGRSGLSQEFITLMETKAGIDGLKQAPSVLGVKITKSRNKPRTLRAKTFHSLRHTFITELRKEGVDLETRQDLAGHEDQEQTRHYTHLDVEVLRRAINRLSSLPAVSASNRL